jgi:membrane peptidoglycan carboxypeptidase
MRESLAMSLNIPAIKTLREVGIDNAIEMAHRLGITTLNERSRYGLALVIGGGEVTLLDETAAFSVFANDGKKNTATSISKIYSAKDNLLIEMRMVENVPVLNPEVARKINSVLSDNDARTPVFGSNNKLFIPGHTVAAKTGTTQEFRDAWTVGYTPSLAVGVWVGNNDNRPMRYGADGSFVAAPIWNQFMSEALKTYPKETFLAYEESPSKNPNVKYELPDFKEKVTYYRTSNGKEISEKKARDMDPDKVRKKVEYVTRNKDEASSSEKSKPVF